MEGDLLVKIEKRAGWNREIGRKLVKILKYTGFEKLDFEAVTIHSDLVGIRNILGNNKVPPEIIRMISRSNPRLAKIMRICSDSSRRMYNNIFELNSKRAETY